MSLSLVAVEALAAAYLGYILKLVEEVAKSLIMLRTP
jgi:hypothetical protein